jgi:N-acetylmuramoyl-L-alanine amidase
MLALRQAYLPLLPLLLCGCGTGLRIDHTYKARSQDDRVQFLIIHCTEENWETSLRILTEEGVSSHYLVRDHPARIYQLVPEERRAYQAGLSSWKGYTQLNAASIGIEIVNAGVRTTPGQPPYPDYPEEQIAAVIALVKAIAARHHLRPDQILAHSDIAPQRKVDPGPRFPWKRLAQAGLIPWPDEDLVRSRLERYRSAVPEVAWFQAHLAEHGFEVPRTGVLDDPTLRVIAAFQMKYRPSRFDGVPDAETAAILDVLTGQAAGAPTGRDLLRK